MRNSTRLLVLFFLLALITGIKATHNRAGEISYIRIAPFTKVVGGSIVPEYIYLITVTKYTDDGPGIADRCVDTVFFGDGERGIAPRINGPVMSCGCGNMGGFALGCGVKIIDEKNP